MFRHCLAPHYTAMCCGIQVASHTAVAVATVTDSLVGTASVEVCSYQLYKFTILLIGKQIFQCYLLFTQTHI